MVWLCNTIHNNALFLITMSENNCAKTIMREMGLFDTSLGNFYMAEALRDRAIIESKTVGECMQHPLTHESACNWMIHVFDVEMITEAVSDLLKAEIMEVMADNPIMSMIKQMFEGLE